MEVWIFSASVVTTGLSFLFAVVYGLSTLRRGVAASLVGEIAVDLLVIESLGLEEAFLGTGDALPPPPPPRFSMAAYQAHTNWIGLLGPYLARVISGLYASLAILQEDLRTLEAETCEIRRSRQKRIVAGDVQRTVDLSDEALRGLRDVVTRRPKRRRG